MVTLAELLEAAVITRVVWVDDLFAQPADESLRVAIQAKLKILYENNHTPRYRELASINPNAPEPILNAQIEAVLDGLTDRLPRLLECLTRQANDCELDIDPEEDLNPAQVVGLLNGLHNVIAYPYRVWITERTRILAEADDKTLFLIDREFLKEGLGDSLGDDILADIVASVPRAHCIMFTHRVGPETVDSLRLEIGRNPSVLEAHQFGVMSKRGLGCGVSDVLPHFSRALRMCLLCRFCYEIANETCSVMYNAALNAVCEMVSFSVESIDAAIFENSLLEGASEFDVVDRILAINQRVASQKALSTKSNLFARLKRIRAVRALEPLELTAAGNTAEPLLHKWRVAEILEEGVYINSLHSPLRCGDVFLNVRNQRQYVLLAQPCDLIVRCRLGQDFGKRRRDEAELVLIEQKDPGECKRETNFIIKGVGDNGEYWLINFRESISINLRILDLAVYNQNGSVSWRLGQRIPIHLLPGWEERFKLLRQVVGSGHDPDVIGALSHADEEHDLCGGFSDSTYSYPLQRIRHIRSPYSEAINASYAAFISRAALSHDFARGL